MKITLDAIREDETIGHNDTSILLKKLTQQTYHDLWFYINRWNTFWLPTAVNPIIKQTEAVREYLSVPFNDGVDNTPHNFALHIYFSYT